MKQRFHDRREAGRQLAAQLGPWRGRRAVVLGLPRGGVEVAFEVARALELPLDVIIVRKLGVPQHSELAMGAIGEDDVLVRDEGVLATWPISAEDFNGVEIRERLELERRTHSYRGDRAPLQLTNAEAVIVDDGVATGSTARAACLVARARGARDVTLATPVMAAQSADQFNGICDHVVALEVPRDLGAVGRWYAEFSATSDETVRELLRLARERQDEGGNWM